jgi:hypothetical protein
LPKENQAKRLIRAIQGQGSDQFIKYQDETRAWGDLKVKLRELNIDDLVLLWSPRTESSDKLELKWVGPYMVIEKSRPGISPIRFPRKDVGASWNADNLHHFYV